MTDEELKRMREFNHSLVEEMKAFNLEEAKRAKERDKKGQESALPPEPVDIYERNRGRAREVGKKKFPNGSSAIVGTAVKAVVGGAGGEGLARACKRAKGDSDSLSAKGERGRANLAKQQYMFEHFLPAVEIVVNSTSPDELLNNKKALEELDKYVLLEGSGRGYTAFYVRQAYGNQLGQVEGRSDDSVRSGVRKINELLDCGENRIAFGIASKLKEQIDNGEKLADDVDYELIGRVVSYFS